MNGDGVTTIEQSKRLLRANIDPITADMSWYRDNVMYPFELHSCYQGHFRRDGDDLVPAWTTNAMLAFLPPHTDLVQLGKGIWCCVGSSTDTAQYCNPRNAVYEAILKAQGFPLSYNEIRALKKAEMSP